MEGKIMTSHLQTISHKRDFAMPYFSLLCGGHKGLYISTIKFEELEDLIRFSNASLRDGIKEDYKATINGEVRPEAQRVLRFYHLKYAILNYNACYDYILQIIYFAFDFCEDITTREIYQEQLVKCTFSNNSKFRQRFKAFSETNTKAKELFDKLDDFYNNKRKQLGGWANAIKHRGGLSIPEMIPNRQNACICNDGEIVFSPQIIYPNIITIDEIIEELKEQNRIICEFSEYLFDFLGFNNVCTNRLSADGWFADVRPFVYTEN